MARDRVVTAFGPSAITVTNTAGAAAAVYSTWQRWGPFRGNQIAYNAVFTRTTAGSRARLQARLSSSSTVGQANLTLINSSASGSQVAGGSTGMFCFVRLASTVLARSTGTNISSVTVTFAAVM